MKTYIFVLSVAFLIALGVGGYWYENQNSVTATNKIQYLGVLDSDNRFDNDQKLIYKHYFVAWGDTYQNDLDIAVTSIKSLQKEAIVTIEPWPQNGDTAEKMYNKIIAGDYDENIRTTCTTLASSSSKPIMRWGHEVDLAGNTRYLWATKDNELFKRGFAHVYTVCKKISPTVQIMWSPAGVDGAEKYFPGPEYVDLVGLSIFGYPAYEKKEFGKESTFDDVFSPRYNRMKQFSKPIVIAELGAAGNDEYKKAWMDQAVKRMAELKTYPLLKGFIYFNAADKNAWIPDIEPPDFRFNPTELTNILNNYVPKK